MAYYGIVKGALAFQFHIFNILCSISLQRAIIRKVFVFRIYKSIDKDIFAIAPNILPIFGHGTRQMHAWVLDQ
jgi:hypothetical protein